VAKVPAVGGEALRELALIVPFPAAKMLVVEGEVLGELVLMGPSDIKVAMSCA
jgi:hypothetical protein